ncbi:hypothetical protein SE17_29195 [Kouleothrix aurantiaca]|uniref:Signal transduction histidine kinase subgroup 3 dimerisation and phosphoacceptor domain-containing protein n=1 Tax=Kouleothrix aurantiaca TaxID=186479 RepID=A0A0N8PRI9_9CHLR|nr:hypothetical protein SE17_29195 [Kouleothrix aurantiaca]
MTSPAPRWLRPFNIFWRIVVAVSLLLGAQDAVGQDATLLRGWRGALMLALILAFAAAYIWFDRNETRQQERWPVPYRTVLLYLIVQLAIVGGLLHFSSSFFGPLLSLLGHVFGALPMRRWWFPAGAIVALLAAPVGIYDAIAERDWGSVFGFVFSLSILIVLAAFVGLMFGEHYRREALIAELRRAKDDLERYATQAEELAALRERTRLAREMHDSLGHALQAVVQNRHKQVFFVAEVVVQPGLRYAHGFRDFAHRYAVIAGCNKQARRFGQDALAQRDIGGHGCAFFAWRVWREYIIPGPGGAPRRARQCCAPAGPARRRGPSGPARPA